MKDLLLRKMVLLEQGNPYYDERGRFSSCQDCGAVHIGSNKNVQRSKSVIDAQHAKLKLHQTELVKARTQADVDHAFKKINATKQFLRHLHTKGFMGD